MSDNKVDLLAFGAHPDDVELSAGGTILKVVSQGKKVALIDLTEGELGTRGTKETRKMEAEKAAEIMGVSYRENLGLADGFFETTEESLKKIIIVLRKYRPKIVLGNAISDRHPDHARAAELVSRACFLSGLLKIETKIDGEIQKPWRPDVVYNYIQDRSITPHFIVDVSPFKERKMEAVLAYETQFYQENMSGPKTPISGKDFLENLEARLLQFGRYIGVQYGEGFTVERPVGVNDLFDLF